jgi:hypothetical protein
MKIRTDFVTNSSSVSYVITMSPDMAEFSYKMTHIREGHASPGNKRERIYGVLSQDLKETGEKIAVGKNDLYRKVYEFEKKPDTLYDQSFPQPVETIDFGAMSDKELWAYIYGEYFVNGRLAAEFKGFGSMQVPRDKERLAQKFCQRIKCENCERLNTPECHDTLRKNSQAQAQ